ncbi:MAG: LytTR family DNA-binding domain-containing protein, partial [Steroidobacteraceae bacterium]
VPACIGLLLGWGHVGQVAGLLPHYLSILYWVGLAVLIWTLNDPATRLISFVLAPTLKRILLVSLLGGVLATLAQRPLVLLYSAGFVQALGIPPPDLVQDVGLKILPGSLQQVGAAIVHCAEWIGLWAIANWALVHVGGKSRFGMKETLRKVGPPARPHAETQVGTETPARAGMQGADAVAPARPILLRAKRDLGSQVLVLQAQDHFVQVTTPVGSELVLYRFNDAIREMGQDAGLQVHRSYWVARDAVRALSISEGQYTLELSNGTRIPVSRARREAVKDYFSYCGITQDSASAAAIHSRKIGSASACST